MKRVINTALSVIVLVLFLPTTLAIASWNSLPGTRLFAVKLAMEQALVTASPSVEAKGNLQIRYTEKRVAEAKQLIADQASVQGLSYLDSQVDTTKDMILTTKDPVVKKQLATKYVATLKDVSVQLQEQKQLVQTSPQVPQPTVSRPSPTSTPVPTRVPVTPVPRELHVAVTLIPTPTLTPTSTPTPTPAPASHPPQSDIVDPINNSQNNIDDAIEEMETITQAPVKEDKKPDKNNDREDKKDNHGGVN